MKRAPVQASGDKPAGTIEWWEHEDACRAYRKRFPHGGPKTAIEVAERGGYGYTELVDLLGAEPVTWKPG